MPISRGICRKTSFWAASPSPSPARSCSGGGCARNPHEVSAGFVGGQVLVGIELHGDSAPLPVPGMTISRNPGAQHPPTTPNRHVFPQGDFGGHGESQLHHRTFGKRRLGVKKYSTATQVLGKSVHSPSIEVNGQRQAHFETLRASPFQTMFRTIGICVHNEHPSRQRSPGLVVSDRRSAKP
jgi:hypothetical protein